MTTTIKSNGDGTVSIHTPYEEAEANYKRMKSHLCGKNCNLQMGCPKYENITTNMYTIKSKNIEVSDTELTDLLAQREAKNGGTPRVGDRYYFCEDSGDTNWSHFHSDSIDLFRYYSHNCFTTEAEAQKYADYLHALADIEKYKHEHGLVWRPDWGDDDQKKWCIEFFEDEFHPDWHYSNNFPIFGSFKSREHAQDIITNCAKELEIIKNYTK